MTEFSGSDLKIIEIKKLPRIGPRRCNYIVEIYESGGTLSGAPSFLRHFGNLPAKRYVPRQGDLMERIRDFSPRI